LVVTSKGGEEGQVVDMISKLISWFRLPVYNNIEQTQKSQFLYITLLVLTGVCVIIGLQDLGEQTFTGVFLFVMAAVCFLGIPLSNRGLYMPVVTTVSLFGLLVITISLIEGFGMQDAAMVGFPLFLIFISFLFNKEITILATLASLASIELVYYLERTGRFIPQPINVDLQLVVVGVLIIGVGLLLWVYKNNWENILRDLRGTYDLTLSGWGQALELRDRETEGHSQRAVEMTIDLAARLGISKQEVEHIRRGALLHDIGKMAVPDAILLKPGKLTPAEWQVVRMHPQQGIRLLENIPYLQPALAIPRSHHEHWDGSGYPEGLAGEAIPFAARIFAVVDVWDALTSDRPYRKAWSARKARDYIRRQSGKSFDPRVVKEFLDLIGNPG
jgi:HD-GYP domain-containing protein (c-di-GMP phosphodiesterase class II)